MYPYVCALVCVCIHTLIHNMCMYTCFSSSCYITYIHTYILNHSSIHTNIHTYIHTYIHTHLLICFPLWSTPAIASVSSVATGDLPGQGVGQGVWVELFDPEDREELKFGDRVICMRHTGMAWHVVYLYVCMYPCMYTYTYVCMYVIKRITITYDIQTNVPKYLLSLTYIHTYIHQTYIIHTSCIHTYIRLPKIVRHCSEKRRSAVLQSPLRRHVDFHWVIAQVHTYIHTYL